MLDLPRYIKSGSLEGLRRPALRPLRARGTPRRSRCPPCPRCQRTARLPKSQPAPAHRRPPLSRGRSPIRSATTQAAMSPSFARSKTSLQQATDDSDAAAARTPKPTEAGRSASPKKAPRTPAPRDAPARLDRTERRLHERAPRRRHPPRRCRPRSLREPRAR